jgi:hypothetical protein
MGYDDEEEYDGGGVSSESVDFSSPEDLDKARRYLEDAVSLLGTDADVTVDVHSEVETDEEEDQSDA